MPLSMMKVGDSLRVMHVGGGDAVRKHLGALGLVAGTVVAVVSVSGDAMIVQIHDSRIAVGGDVTRHVTVEPMR